MNKNGKSTQTSKTTVTLSVILSLLVIVFLANFVIYPAYKDYRRSHMKIDIYGGMTDELKDCDLFSDLQSGRSVCFLGDSITNGTETDGIAWCHPLVPYITGPKSNFSRGGWKVKDLLDHVEEIPPAEIYVIAIGINDVLFSGSVQSAYTPSEFTTRCGQLADLLLAKAPGAKIYFIAPWTFVDLGDDYLKRGDQFRNYLGKWCEETGYSFINPDPVIVSVLGKEGSERFMLNEFHPGVPDGVALFSYAVLKADHDQK